MNSNCFLSDFSNEHDCNWEFQLENMVSKLVDESEQSFNSNIFEDENVFNFGDTSKEDKTLSPLRNQDVTSSTISSSPKANCLKYERSNVKSSTFNGKTYFKNGILLKSIAPSKSYPQSSQCLFGYSLYDNSSNQNVSKEENNLETLLNKITSQLTQHEQITLEVYQMIKGKFINIIKSHKGSKLFQSYLKKTQYSIIYLIYQELQYDLVGIISNLYSNYFFTKFYTCLHKKHRIEIISIISNHFISLSCDNIGAFPIQSIIEQAHNYNTLCSSKLTNVTGFYASYNTKMSKIEDVCNVYAINAIMGNSNFTSDYDALLAKVEGRGYDWKSVQAMILEVAGKAGIVK